MPATVLVGQLTMLHLTLIVLNGQTKQNSMNPREKPHDHPQAESKLFPF